MRNTRRWRVRLSIFDPKDALSSTSWICCKTLLSTLVTVSVRFQWQTNASYIVCEKVWSWWLDSVARSTTSAFWVAILCQSFCVSRSLHTGQVWWLFNQIWRQVKQKRCPHLVNAPMSKLLWQITQNLSCSNLSSQVLNSCKYRRRALFRATLGSSCFSASTSFCRSPSGSSPS